MVKIKEFNEELEGWLPFCSQFEKIGSNPSDKMQYLIKPAVINSSAKKIVESYPATW